MLATLPGTEPQAPEPSPPSEPDSYARIWHDWLGDLDRDGSLEEHLTAPDRQRARRLLAKPDSDPDGLVLRELVLRAMKSLWAQRQANGPTSPV